MIPTGPSSRTPGRSGMQTERRARRSPQPRSTAPAPTSSRFSSRTRGDRGATGVTRGTGVTGDAAVVACRHDAASRAGVGESRSAGRCRHAFGTASARRAAARPSTSSSVAGSSCSRRLHASVATTSGEPRFDRRRASRRGGRLTLCVRAQDRAGNRRALSCAPVWIRAQRRGGTLHAPLQIRRYAVGGAWLSAKPPGLRGPSDLFTTS